MLRVSLLMKDLDGAHWEGALCIALHLANADCRYRLAVMSDVTLSLFLPPFVCSATGLPAYSDTGYNDTDRLGYSQTIY